jgi:hypothetical protein
LKAHTDDDFGGTEAVYGSSFVAEFNDEFSSLVVQ